MLYRCLYHHLGSCMHIAVFAAVITLSVGLGCDPPPPEPEGDGDNGEGDNGEGDNGVSLRLPTHGSSAVADEGGTTLIVATKGSGSVSFFDLVADKTAPTLRATLAIFGEPVSVSLSGGGTLYVVDRSAGTVSEVTGARGATPVLARSLSVGPEPIQGALSPSGKRLYVSSWVTGRLTVIDTRTMTVSSIIDLEGNPYAVCVSNDGDDDDDDESIFVSDFYSRPIPTVLEGTDGSRFARVFKVNAANEGVEALQLLPLATSGVPLFESTSVFPNQLYSCTVNAGRVYITNVGASPAAFNGGTDFHQNLQGLVSVIDALTGDEVPEDSINLNALIATQDPPRRFASIPVDITFIPGTEFAYVVSLAADAAFRIDFTPLVPVVGVAAVSNFLSTGKSPTGIVSVGTTAYVSNDVGRSISVLDLAAQQTVTQDIEAAPQPTDPDAIGVLRGQRFFETGQGRWSSSSWVSCAGCHPGGGTDNVTWVFPTGPRQTIDLTGTFSADGATQRILNWTAIFDEIHDFEANTRNVAGGTGAIVDDVALNEDGSANVGAQINLNGNDFNLGSSRLLAQGGATPEDWNDIESYLKSIRTPRGDDSDAAQVARGRSVFEGAKCQNCHGGPLWTSSERYYDPVADSDFSTLTLFSQGVLTVGQVRPDQVKTVDTNQLSVLQNDAGGPARHSCVVRKVGTFDVAGPDDRGGAETRANGNAAQGADGFNIPSLLGAGRGAPYLHAGSAESLEQLLDPAGEFLAHLRGGNLVFAPGATDVADLIAFVRSIDDDTETFVVPAGQRFCPTAITP